MATPFRCSASKHRRDVRGLANRRFAPVLLAAAMALGSTGAAHAVSFSVTFGTQNGGVSLAAQATINSALSFYTTTFSDPVTVALEFHNDAAVFGQSFFAFYFVPYATFRTNLLADASPGDDTTAAPFIIANGGLDPVINGANVGVKSANGRAFGLSLAAATTGGTCSAGTFDGCIGLGLSAIGPAALATVVQHEVDEVLGLGSGLPTTSIIWPEDLFRYAGPGARSFATNASATNPCGAGTPRAFFSINGGASNINEFNNCNNGGDYGDWITHTPSQVQDAFTNLSATPTLTAGSSELRALDVVGWTLAVAVPEPGTWVLFGLGLLALGGWRLRSAER